MRVKFNGYSNPTGKGHDRNFGQECCDSYDTTNCTGYRQCDSYFIYCLRPFGEDRLNQGCHPNETRTNSSFNEDDDHLDFSQSTVLNLPNPQFLRGLGDTYAVSDHQKCYNYTAFLPLYNYNCRCTLVSDNDFIIICREFNSTLRCKITMHIIIMI